MIDHLNFQMAQHVNYYKSYLHILSETLQSPADTFSDPYKIRFLSVSSVEGH